MRLEQWRSMRGLRRRDVAEAIGTTSVSIGRYERRLRVPRPHMLKRISDFTHGEVTANDFYDDDGDDSDTGREDDGDESSERDLRAAA